MVERSASERYRCNRHDGLARLEERGDGSSIIVTLKREWEFCSEDPGCGVKGFDTVAEARSGCVRLVGGRSLALIDKALKPLPQPPTQRSPEMTYQP